MIPTGSYFMRAAFAALAFVALNSATAQQTANQRLTQTKAASLLKTSQSRLARMAAGAPPVFLDLLVRGLFAFGATWKELSKAT